MEPSRQRPTASFRGFGAFLTAVIKKRFFLVFLILALLLFLLQAFALEFSLPASLYLGVVFIGFVWSSFQVYQDMLLARKKLSNTVPIKKFSGSRLSASYFEGNKYVYSLSDPYEGRNQYITKMLETKGVECHYDDRGVFFINGEVYYVMGKGTLEINLRLHNSGDMSLDIRSVDVDHNLELSHFRMVEAGVFRHGGKLRYPLHLEAGEIIAIQIKYKISTNQGSNAALFAADFRALPRLILHEFSFDTIDLMGNEQMYTLEIETPSKPLSDMYVKQWREYDQEEFLVLAVGDFTSGK